MRKQGDAPKIGWRYRLAIGLYLRGWTKLANHIHPEPGKFNRLSIVDCFLLQAWRRGGYAEARRTFAALAA